MHPGWIGFQKLVYCFASTDIRAMLNRLRSVLLFYLWSGYVNITKWSLEPLICTSGYIATRPSIQVQSLLYIQNTRTCILTPVLLSISATPLRNKRRSRGTMEYCTGADGFVG